MSLIHEVPLVIETPMTYEVLEVFLCGIQGNSLKTYHAVTGEKENHNSYKIIEMTRNTMTVTVMGTALGHQKVFNEMLVGEQEMK
jgi:hypothetical protein